MNTPTTRRETLTAELLTPVVSKRQARWGWRAVLALLPVIACPLDQVFANALTGHPALLNSTAVGDTGFDGSVDIEADGFGGMVAVWSSSEALSGSGTDSDILVARSADGGSTWTTAVLLNTNAVGDTGADFNPSLASDRNGHLVVVWQSNTDLSGAGTDPDVLVATSADNGVTWSPPAVLNSNATTNSGFAFKEPKVATDGKGTWIACWTSIDGAGLGLGGDQDILCAISSDHGANWGTAAALNTEAAVDLTNLDFNPDLHVNRAGIWIASWVFDDGVSDVMESHSTDGGQTWSPQFGLHTGGPANDGQDALPDVHVDVNGNAMIVWESGSTLGNTVGDDQDPLFVFSDDGGVTWTLPAAVNTNAMDEEELDSFPTVAADECGHWVVVWSSEVALFPALGTDADILAAHFQVGAQSWSAPLPVARNADSDSGGDTAADVTFNDSGNLAVAWQSDENLGGAGGDSDLFVVAVEKAVFWSPTQVLNANAGGDSGADFQPDIASSGDGTLIAAWSSVENLSGAGIDSDIFYARSLDGGATWDGPHLLNTNAAADTGSDRVPSLVHVTGQVWLCAWESSDPAGLGLGTDNDILYGISANDGVSWSAPAALNTTAATDVMDADYNPRVASDGAGNLVTVWGGGGLFDAVGDADIAYSRSIDSGQNWSTPAPMNPDAATDADDEFDGTVATDGAGTWLAVWFSNSPSGGLGLAGLGTDDDLIFRRSVDNGLTWSSGGLLTINAATDLAEADDVVPDLAGDGQGNWVAVWHLEGVSFEGTAGDESDTLSAWSSNDGVSWSPAQALHVRVGETDEESPPRIITNGDGLWTAAWAAVDEVVGGQDLVSLDDSEIVSTFSCDNGLSWSQPAAVNDYAPVDDGQEFSLTLAPDGNSRFLAAWSSRTDLNGNGTDVDVFFAPLRIPSHYERWLKRRFTLAELANPALEASVWGVNADDDGDGVATLVEYYMRLDPRAPDADGGTVISFPAVGLLEICYRKSKDPNLTTTCMVEWSENLISWKQSGELHSNGSPVVIALQPPVDQGSHVKVCAQSNVAAFPSLYLRVRIVSP